MSASYVLYATIAKKYGLVLVPCNSCPPAALLACLFSPAQPGKLAIPLARVTNQPFYLTRSISRVVSSFVQVYADPTNLMRGA
jgi:hypothetical protein